MLQPIQPIRIPNIKPTRFSGAFGLQAVFWPDKSPLENKPESYKWVTTVMPMVKSLHKQFIQDLSTCVQGFLAMDRRGNQVSEEVSLRYKPPEIDKPIARRVLNRTYPIGALWRRDKKFSKQVVKKAKELQVEGEFRQRYGQIFNKIAPQYEMAEQALEEMLGRKFHWVEQFSKQMSSLRKDYEAYYAKLSQYMRDRYARELRKVENTRVVVKRVATLTPEQTESDMTIQAVELSGFGGNSEERGTSRKELTRRLIIRTFKGNPPRSGEHSNKKFVNRLLSEAKDLWITTLTKSQAMESIEENTSPNLLEVVSKET